MKEYRMFDVLEALDKRISKLEGGIVASADALADLEYRHLKRIEALEEKHNHKPIFDRLSALEGDGEDNAELILDHQLRLTDLETLHYKGKYPEAHNYLEPVHNEPTPHTCGECAQPFRKAGYQLSCFERRGFPLGKSPQWRDPTDDACPNFEAIQ